MTASQFIDDWIMHHPKDCARIGQAVLRAYCLDTDIETSKNFINLKKIPDLRDADRLIINAISKGSFKKKAQANESLWSGMSGLS